MVQFALRLYTILSAMAVLWFIFVPSKSAMGIAGDERLVLPRRKYLPVIAVIWFGVLGVALPLAVYIEWQLAAMGKKFEYSLLLPVSLGISIAAVVGFSMRPRVWCSIESIRYRTMLGPVRTMAWSDISSARWSAFRGALLLTNQNGSVVAIKSSYDGFLEFLCDYAERIDATRSEAIPEKWRQRAEAFRASQALNSR